MSSKARVMVVSLDAADAGLVREFARAGQMPTFARLLREAAIVDTLAPVGVFVGGNWPTIFTALSPDRHRFICWDEYRGGTYEYRQTDPTMMRGTPFWEHLSHAGRRVAVLDVPHALARPVNGAMVVEWGAHDRHFGPASWPPELVGELQERHGSHFGSMDPVNGDQFAPCDYSHRDGWPGRTAEESAALFDAICRGVENKRRMSLDMLDRGGWDLFLNVMGESHCIGHQLWHLHDPTHERHDPELARRLGGDPVLDVYRRLDAVVADHLARLTPEDTAYVVLAHGMTVHHDGTHLLDHVLNRLDWALDEPNGFGAGTRAAAAAARWIPRPVRGRTLRLAAPLVRDRAGNPAPEPLPPPAERRWFQAPNNTVVGAVRLNLAGREPAGRIHPADRRAALRWLAHRLEELVNLDSGGRVVRRCVVADDVYRRSPDDTFGDLYVEWERGAPIERVWSPAIGTVAIPYEHWRQGDHVREGMTFALGPGIRRGHRRRVHPVFDLGATFAAATGVELPDVDGVPIASILPAGVEKPRGRRRIAERARRRVDTGLRRSAERHVPRFAHRVAPPAHQQTSAELTAIDGLEARVGELEHRGDIATMSSWLPHAVVAEDLLISVVMPTRNRRELLAEAIASVEAQTYARWELIVVDDGSTDGTPAVLESIDDPRIRALGAGGVGECAARNVGLDAARGDVIAYLDDDNRFDPQWLKAVAHTFTSLTQTTVAYGARICDDSGRTGFNANTGRPWLQWNGWDERAVREFNVADTNALAHRPSAERFDEQLTYAGDWDLLLRLSAESAPVAIPAIAAYYRSDVPGRVSTELTPEEIERQLAAIRRKHSTT